METETESGVVAIVGEGRLLPMLRELDYEPLVLSSLDGNYWAEARTHPRVVVLDASNGEHEDLEQAVVGLHRVASLTDVIVWAPGAPPSFVREALRVGVREVALFDEPAKLGETIERVLRMQVLLPKLRQLSTHRARGSRFDSLLSRNPAMWDLFEMVTRVAPSDATVLIAGETGTGKELLARAIHRRCGRTGVFAALNCASVPEHLIEAELCGYEKGAFTGADRARSGIVRHANGGTLFLDEVGDMPAHAQLSLLRVLQQGTVRPIGGYAEMPVDVRVIAATHVGLEEAVRSGRFREDLYYRLDVIRLAIPPLRDRREDIVYLFGYFMRKLARHHAAPRPEISVSFIDALAAYDWPGNVRQLENFAERLVLSGRSNTLTTADFTRLMRTRHAPRVPSGPSDSLTLGEATPTTGADLNAQGGPDTSLSLHDYLDPIVSAHERAYLEALLAENGGRIEDSAHQAGVTRRTLLRKLRTLDIDKNDFKRRARNAEAKPNAS